MVDSLKMYACAGWYNGYGTSCIYVMAESKEKAMECMREHLKNGHDGMGYAFDPKHIKEKNVFEFGENECDVTEYVE